ncbi:MAG: NAD-dependent epimerase/dehydratase family protein [Gammaproteobacteria bacterium]|nr:NAD-dependent epimerase/dehydratase family protein [Gammaproteobacteria bacterium]
MRVFVTGSAGCLAQSLLPKLCAHPAVEQVFGVDRKLTRFTYPKFHSSIGDVRNHSFLQKSMQGYDAVIHLAFAIAQINITEAEMHDNNVNGTRAVFAVAKQLNIRKTINLSSVSVYGSGENITENKAFTPSPKFAYARHKAEIEHHAAAEYPAIIHLRAHFIFGPNSQRFLHTLCNNRVFVSLPPPVPTLQVVHESDVSSAILKALELPVSGAFNIAADEVVTLPAFVKNGRKLMLPLPIRGVRYATAVAKRLGSQEDFTWADIIDTTLTVSCDRAKQLLQWRPEFSAWDTRAAMNRAAK